MIAITTESATPQTTSADTASHRTSSASAIVTVAIVPREKNGCAVMSLRSLLDNTTVPFELVYVDGGSPRHVRAEIDTLLGDRPHHLHRVDRYLGPFEASNIAIEAADTPYLVIADNDILFRPGWLEGLLDCARERDADVVAPLVLIGGPDSDVIHVAGGKAHVCDADGRRRIHHEQFFEDRSSNDPALQLVDAPTELVESHCILARTATWRHLGPLDPSVGHAGNVDDLSMSFAARGASMWFTPRSEVVYLFDADLPMDRHDVHLLSYIWSEAWTSHDRAWLADKYGVDAPGASADTIDWWLGDHRRIWLGATERRVRRFFEELRIPIVGHVIWKLVERIESGVNVAFVAVSSRFGRLREPAAVHLRRGRDTIVATTANVAA